MRRRLSALIVAAIFPLVAASAQTKTNNDANSSAKENSSSAAVRSNTKTATAAKLSTAEKSVTRYAISPVSAKSSDAANAAAQDTDENQPPLSFKVGGADFTPVGFLDFTTVYRSTNVGSGIGTSFGSIPFNGSSPAGRLSETRFSAQNSRIGLRVDANPSANLKLTGYLEADFLGNAPGNLEVTSHSDTLHMRLYWVDAHYGKWEFLGGQSWSMMTPNRKGISPMPSDIFYTQDMDTNYQAGLVWLRTPGFRVVYHADDRWTLGLALDDPEQFTGGLVILPAGFNAAQVDDSGGNAKTPNAAPDVIAQIAYDTSLGSHAFHIEAAGLYRAFRLNTAATNANVTRSGGGGSVNVNFEIVKNLRLMGTSFWSDGGGRYIFGLGPDFVVKTDAAGNFIPSPLHAGAGIGGFEYQLIPQTMIYGYYGASYFGRDFQEVAAGSPPPFVGYGFAGSNSSQNRTIQEGTVGLIETLEKSQLRRFEDHHPSFLPFTQSMVECRYSCWGKERASRHGFCGPAV